MNSPISSGAKQDKVFTICVIKVRSPAFWVSSYSDYQVFLSDKIAEFREDGQTFKWIADWLNENGFQTPRGKTFSDRHVHGILKKRRLRDERFLREPVVTIVSAELHYEPDLGSQYSKNL